MIPEKVLGALSRIASRPDLDEVLRARWRAGGREVPRAHLEVPLPEDIAAAADHLVLAMPSLMASRADFGALLAEPVGEVALAWCAASAWHRDAPMAAFLEKAATEPRLRDRVITAARSRVVEGPLLDALACAPLLGATLVADEGAEARARLEILIWEAGASAIEIPGLGPWLFGSPAIFDALVRTQARGALRGRVLAARCLEVSLGGIPKDADQEIVGQTLQVLQPLLLHPEPLVWIHAARALGRLTGVMEQLEGMIVDWALGDTHILKQRAMTALASVPAERATFLLSSQLTTIVHAKDAETWGLAAIAAATPYLFFERREMWNRLAKRILAGDGGAVSARALARGLGTLWRRGVRGPDVETPLRKLREMARRERSGSLDQSRRWIEVITVTDGVDGAERDPLDLELGLENLVRVAAQYDDEEADARAARIAMSLGSAFDEARNVVLAPGRLRQRASAMNAIEGCARAFALRLWTPLLATSPSLEPIHEPDLTETWNVIARAPAEILEVVAQRRATEGVDLDAELPLEVLAIRLGGYALDACGDDGGPTAHFTCLWLRRLAGLADGSRELPPSLKGALSTLFWRLVDTTRGTALGEVDDVEWLGPFAAWWALVIDRPAMLLQLANALPMMADGALALCCERAEALRTAVASGAPDGQWGAAASKALEALFAHDTELAHALAGLAKELDAFKTVAGPKPGLDARCLELVLAGQRLQTALADPVRALHDVGAEMPPSSIAEPSTENAPRVAALLARAIRGRDLGLLDVWFASLGPVTSALLEGAVRGAIRRTPPPPPQPKKNEPKVIEGYELVRPLGEGGIGSVWLVRRPGADRLFVLKIPKAEALASATDTERSGILASFVEEAKALAGLYHPNVANIIDRGVSGSVPFLVLEYLIGADLKQYSSAKLMTLFELRQIVVGACAGLAALHAAGLVHRDIKPANLWLRLPLAGGEKFDPKKHRDPAVTPPLATVVIDFGMVRAVRVPPEVGGRFVAGTAGYIAPEQVLDPVELDPRSDVYALAGTIYNLITGRAFFDEIENSRDRIIAHMRQDPLEDPERLRPFPVGVAKLLRAATARNAADRPDPMEFSREFVSAI